MKAPWKFTFIILCIAILMLSVAVSPPLAASRESQDPAIIYPETPDPFVGDWKGQWLKGEPKFPNIDAQVVALGGGQYQVYLVPKIYQRTPPLAVVTASAKEGKLVFNENNYFGEIDGDQFKGGRGDDAVFEMKRFTLVSPTLGAKPPKKALVLFEGKDFDQWEPFKNGLSWTLLDGGVMMANPKAGTLVARKLFTDVRIHLEFRTPFLPAARGQRRGNGGVYIQGRYEVQVLDSYGLAGYWNECGALYKRSAPHVNMCAPPLHWQTYDIEYRIARFDDEGDVTAPPRITVLHNGVVIHKDFDLMGQSPTTLEKKPRKPRSGPGRFKLQSHGNRVQYRNIWAIDLTK